MSSLIPFNKPCVVGNELEYVRQAAQDLRHLSGDGHFTRIASQWMMDRLNARKVLLTPSCTHALEMVALLLDIRPGDEVIMPSFTFVSTANAFALRGGRPVFVDIRHDTLNIDETLIESAITPRTRAILVVHYAGVACEIDTIMDIAAKHKLAVVEDAAHALGGTYKGRYLGTIGTFGTYSFHETKNITCGEGGALVINEERYIERAEIIREKGTNRSKFFRGQVDKYTWVDIGSSYLLADLNAAYLCGQLEQFEIIQHRRRNQWFVYYNAFKDVEDISIPNEEQFKDSTYHIFYLLAQNLDHRSKILSYLKQNGVHAVFHYVPLHSTLQGNTAEILLQTDSLSERLFRLPLYFDLTESEQANVIAHVKEGIRA